MKKTERKDNKNLIIILVIIALLVAITVTIIVKVANKNKKPAEVANTQTAVSTDGEENEVIPDYVQVLEDGSKLNTNSKLNEMKQVEGLNIGNIQLVEQNNQTVLLADVENKTGKDLDVKLIDITLLDQDGKELGTIAGIISPVKANEKVQLNASTTGDYSSAFDFKITMKK